MIMTLIESTSVEDTTAMGTRIEKKSLLSLSGKKSKVVVFSVAFIPITEGKIIINGMKRKPCKTL
jgi:hypothetical protein